MLYALLLAASSGTAPLFGMAADPTTAPTVEPTAMAPTAMTPTAMAPTAMVPTTPAEYSGDDRAPLPTVFDRTRFPTFPPTSTSGEHSTPRGPHQCNTTKL